MSQFQCAFLKMNLLSKLRSGQRARVLSVDVQGTSGQRLLSMGLLPGIELNVVKVAPLGDPIAVEFSGQRISLRRTEAASVEIELAS